MSKCLELDWCSEVLEKSKVIILCALSVSVTAFFQLMVYDVTRSNAFKITGGCCSVYISELH